MHLSLKYCKLELIREKVSKTCTVRHSTDARSVCAIALFRLRRWSLSSKDFEIEKDKSEPPRHPHEPVPIRVDV